jgi:translation initiation factor IF-2
MSVKLQDLAGELQLSEGELLQYVRSAAIAVPEGVKRIPEKDAARLRGFIRDQRRREAKKQETVRIPSIVSVRALAEKLELPAGEVIKQLLKSGVVATLNEDLDFETAAIVSSDLGYTTTEDVTQLEEDILTPEKLEEILTKEDPAKREPRAPVVTVMGHVDHGKTTLLDAIRETKVAATEAGGITQRISSYQAKKKGKAITFIDTPGHEAFEFMRKRGASLADIGILVVAADDGVKEQTIEAVRHAKDAGIPLIVAITKVDKPGGQPDRVKRQVADLGLVPEEYGGETPVVPLSAKTGVGIDTLLDTILLMAELHAPTAVVDRPALGTVVESRRDPGMGPLASVLLHAGTLRLGNSVVVGTVPGTVRQLLDFNGRPVKEAKPSAPVTIVGLEDLPAAGDILQVVAARTAARKKAARGFRALPKAAPTQAPKPARERAEKKGKEEKREKEEEEKPREIVLPLVLKADSQGSLEAARQTVGAMGAPGIRARILRSDVGNITESDIMTAQAAAGVVLGFNVTVSPAAARLADKDRVQTATYRIIYELTEDVRQRLEALLPPEVVREDLGKMTVLKVFFSIRGRQIVGGRVTSGTVKAKEQVEAFRGTERTARGKITQLQQNRAEIDAVKVGQEGGITFEGTGKIKEGDQLVIFHEETRQRRLADAQRTRAAQPTS